ncbi:STAS domain-containing protein [Pseudonocardia sp. P1]|uniref:STAS domain-containing protein n=1 Tax=Pseudonocardia sp. P1 TaxID=761194 RepID=UPI00307E7645
MQVDPGIGLAVETAAPGVRLVRVSGRLDGPGVAALGRLLDAQRACGRVPAHLVVDVTGVTEFDGTAVETLGSLVGRTRGGPCTPTSPGAAAGPSCSRSRPAGSCCGAARTRPRRSRSASSRGPATRRDRRRPAPRGADTPRVDGPGSGAPAARDRVVATGG